MNDTTTQNQQLDAIDDPNRSTVAMCEDRLARIEQQLQLQRVRLVQTISRICLVSVIVYLALTFAGLTLVFVVWESARVTAVAVLALLYSGLAAAILVSFKRHLRTGPDAELFDGPGVGAA